MYELLRREGSAKVQRAEREGRATVSIASRGKKLSTSSAPQISTFDKPKTAYNPEDPLGVVDSDDEAEHVPAVADEKGVVDKPVLDIDAVLPQHLYTDLCNSLQIMCVSALDAARYAASITSKQKYHY